MSLHRFFHFMEIQVPVSIMQEFPSLTCLFIGSLLRDHAAQEQLWSPAERSIPLLAQKLSCPMLGWGRNAFLLSSFQGSGSEVLKEGVCVCV